MNELLGEEAIKKINTWDDLDKLIPEDVVRPFGDETENTGFIRFRMHHALMIFAHFGKNKIFTKKMVQNITMSQPPDAKQTQKIIKAGINAGFLNTAKEKGFYWQKIEVYDMV